jgi:hypothetical protein
MTSRPPKVLASIQDPSASSSIFKYALQERTGSSYARDAGFSLRKGALGWRYDLCVDYRDISERVALLTQEIRELQRVNEPLSTHSEGKPRMDRASREQRELRLKQIKQELLGMMSKSTQREQ